MTMMLLVIQDHMIQSEHEEPPKKTCATTVLHGTDLSQLIRCEIDLMALFRKEQRGIQVVGV
jgi:hypothetical protein